MWAKRANGDTLRQSWGVLNQSWARGSENLEGGGGDGPVHRVHLHIVCSFRGVHAGLETMGGMAGKNPFYREANHSGHPHRRLRGGREDGSSSVAEAEVRENG